jgi:hypothetical protein
MNRIARLTLIALIALPVLAQRPKTNDTFASDQQTVPVMANVTGIGGKFISYVALLNPTSSAYPVTASLYDANGTKREAVINLAAGELKTYANFLDTVFQYTGGGAVIFRSASPANRFIVNSEVRSGGYSTPVPALEFAGSNSRSYSAGVTVDTSSRTNIGCFNQSGVANTVVTRVFDSTGTQTIGSVTMTLPPNAWGQTAVPQIVSDGFVRFEPAEAAVCYAVVVAYTTNDGRFIPATEYQP